MQCLNLRKCGFNLSYNFDRRIDLRRVSRDFYIEHFFSSFIDVNGANWFHSKPFKSEKGRCRGLVTHRIDSLI